jgi:hypothetical protein
MPENIANQPFVIGNGPSRMRSDKPPTPASSAQAHATNHATAKPNIRIWPNRFMAPNPKVDGRGSASLRAWNVVPAEIVHRRCVR